MAIKIKDFIVEMKMDENGQIVFTVQLEGSNNLSVIPAEQIEELNNGYKICFTHNNEKNCLNIIID